MSPSDTQRVAQSFALYAAYYRVRLEDEVLKMYADDLADLDYASVRNAMDVYRKNPKNRTMPLPSMIREIITPDVDPESAAREIAARITAAIPKFGWCNRAAAEEFIGEQGWGIVERQGGWAYICEHHGVSIDPTAFQAQVREQAKADLKFTPSQMAKAIGLGNGAKRGELQSFGEIIGLSERHDDQHGG